MAITVTNNSTLAAAATIPDPAGTGLKLSLAGFTIAASGTQNVATTLSSIVGIVPFGSNVDAPIVSRATANSSGVYSLLSSTGSSYIQMNNVSTNSAVGGVILISQA